MAQGKPAPTGAPPDAAQVARLIEKGNSKSAVEVAKLIHKRVGTPVTERLLVDAYCARIRSLLDHRFTAEAEALVALVRQRYPASAERLSLVRQDMLTAGGGLEDMVRPLADPSVSAEARAAAEASIRAKLSDPALLASCTALPADHPLRRAAEAIRRALDAVTSGPVDDSALLLPEISRRSPLANWKPLLRAIACYYRREDAACREHLQAVEPGSAPAKLKPALEAMLSGGDARALSPAASALARGARGDLDGLRASMANLERAFPSGRRPRIQDGIRNVFALAQRECPEIVSALRRQVSVQAMLADISPGPVVAAMGGPPRADARYFLMQARAVESLTDNPLAACHVWEHFRRAAIEEKWFPARGPEASVLYLHMAELADYIEEHELEEEYRSLDQTYRREAPEGFDPGAAAVEYLHPEWLFEQACRMDPAADSFIRWVEWAEDSKPAAVEKAALTWSKALPGDPRPLLQLMELAEQRGALKKAMGLLRQAERIDGVNAEVRRARLRLLLRTAIQHIKRGKPRLAEAELADLEALPQARENDRPAFVGALRFAAALASGDAEAAQAIGLKQSEAMGSPLTWSIVAAATGGLCGVPLGVRRQEMSGSWVEAVCRAFTLGADLGFTFSLPEAWTSLILTELRRPGSADPVLLEKLCLIALRSGRQEIAFEATAAGLSKAKGAEARFLFLRSRILPSSEFVRAEQCLKAAAALARLNKDSVLEAEALRCWNETSMAGSFGVALPNASRREIERVLRRERAASLFEEPDDDFDFEFDDPAGPPFPPRRRGRRKAKSVPIAGQDDLPF